MDLAKYASLYKIENDGRSKDICILGPVTVGIELSESDERGSTIGGEEMCVVVSHKSISYRVSLKELCEEYIHKCPGNYLVMLDWLVSIADVTRAVCESKKAEVKPVSGEDL